MKEHLEKKKSKGADTLLEEFDKKDTVMHSLHDRVEQWLNTTPFPLKQDQILENQEAVWSFEGLLN